MLIYEDRTKLAFSAHIYVDEANARILESTAALRNPETGVIEPGEVDDDFEDPKFNMLVKVSEGVDYHQQG